MRRSLILALIFACCVVHVLTQQPPTVQVRLFRPPPNQLRQSDLWRIQLNNLGRVPIRVYLLGIVMEARDGEIVNAQSTVITLQPGPTQMTGTQLEPIKLNHVHPRYRDLYLRTGEVPSGNYTVCVYVRSAETDEELGRDCYDQSVERTSPPILVQPTDGDSLASDVRPIFSWLPPTPISPGLTVTYTIRIVEMLGRQTPYDAMLRNPAYYEQSNLRSTTLQYPLDARPFRTDRMYAWKVSAYAGPTLLGESEVWHFALRATIQQPTKQVTPKQSISALAAGASHSLAVVNSLLPVTIHPVALKPEYMIAALEVQSTSAMGDSAILQMINQRSIQRNLQATTSPAQVTTTLSKLWTMYLKGRLYCWGNNSDNQAAGTGPAVTTPQLQTLSDVVAIAAGFGHSLAITSDGKLWGWGRNDYGQLAEGSSDNISTPRAIAHPTGKKFIAVAAGQYHSLALDEERTIWAWGINLNGEIGIGTSGKDSITIVLPRQVTVQGALSVPGIRSIAAGVAHSMALSNEAKVYVWGSDFYGQLGFQYTYPSQAIVRQPMAISSIDGIIAIAAGDYHCLALSRTGTVWAWGDNRSGQVHPDSGTIVWNPVPVPGLDDVIEIAAGSSFSVALRRDSTVWVWGNNGMGTYGNGSRIATKVPVKIPSLSGIVRIAAGGSHILALRADGTLFAWGNDNVGQLGRGTITDLVDKLEAQPLQPAPVVFGGP
jgi:alpha-tubulin suppressor-like RCC1 family protein